MPVTKVVSGIVREPLLHFVLIGLVIFMLYPQQPQQRPDSGGDQVIAVTQPVVDRLTAQFSATWNRPPTPEEIAGLIDSHIREEVLYREALALGLDQGDAVIRQRLRLKMEFVGEAAAAMLAPDEAVLAAWYEANAAAFTDGATIGFRQVMLADPSEAGAVLAALAEGADPATLGRGTLLPGIVDRATAQSVDGAFGPGFFDAVAAQSQGEWAGPVASSYGWHMVEFTGMDVPEAPPLDSIRDAVVAAWRQEQAEVLRESQYAALRARYDVILPQAAE
jgi:hypothetical protein